MSYTEEKHALAGDHGIARRIFMLSEDSTDLGIPPAQLGYGEHTFEMQKAFRGRLSGSLVASVGSPEQLATEISKSLADLERQVREDGETDAEHLGRRSHNIPAHGDAVIRRAGKIEDVVERLLAGASVRVASLRGAGGVGKTILAEQVCRDPRVIDRFPGGTWKVTVGEDPDADKIARELHHLVTGTRRDR
jgi:hypothetical protein